MITYTKDILRKILQESIYRGWLMRDLGVTDSSEEILHNIDWYLDNFSLNDIVFSIGFAKAFFGIDLVKIDKDKFKPRWKIELAKLATRSNRIKYLNKFIHIS